MAAKSFKYSSSSCAGRVLIKELLGSDGGESQIGNELIVGGWVRTGREQQKGAIAFLAVVDGSVNFALQVVVNKEIYNLKEITSTGTSVAIKGDIVASQGNKQKIEMLAKEILYVGPCTDPKYALSKTGHSLEHLRGYPHLRPRSNLFLSIFRIRNALATATHTFFQSNGFYYVTTPIITASDCEGAGEMFQVTTLLPGAEETVPTISGATEEALKAASEAVSAEGGKVKALKEAKASKEEIGAAVGILNKKKQELQRLKDEGRVVGGLPQTPESHIDNSKDFFKTRAHLTVSGQLQAEAFACSMGNVYTFCPTFRAEDSHTTRHLAEFWMIEPELAFADLFDDMRLAEDYVKFCCKEILDNYLDDIQLIDQWRKRQVQLEEKQAKSQGGKKGKKKPDPATSRTPKVPAETRLRNVLEADFARISYTDAIEKLKGSDKKFENTVEWGIDLASEHERWLAEEVFGRPTIIYNYPKDIKAFYMRMNDDEKTVAAMDVVCPQVGELIGGSQREERFDKLEKRINDMGLAPEDFEWYQDLRKYGSVQHAGFGLGFGRLVQFVTGMENIRDVVPFPRWAGSPPM